MPDDVRLTVETFYRAFAGEPDLLAGVVTPEWEDIPRGPGQAPGPDGVRPTIEMIGTALSGATITVHDLVDGRGPDGDGRIAVRAELRGTHVGALLGVPPTDREVSIPMHEFHQITSGRIAVTWHLEDWFGFFNQTGATVVTPSEVAA
jgi:predicted ester cyclase